MKTFKQFANKFRTAVHLRKLGVKLCPNCQGWGGGNLGKGFEKSKINDHLAKTNLHGDCATCGGTGWQHLREEVLNTLEVIKFFKELKEEAQPKICSSCGEEYHTRRHKLGLITQCDDCGREEEQERGVRRHVGTITGISKQAITNIIKNPSASMTAAVKQYNTNPRAIGTGSTFSNVGISGEKEKKNAPKN